MHIAISCELQSHVCCDLMRMMHVDNARRHKVKRKRGINSQVFPGSHYFLTSRLKEPMAVAVMTEVGIISFEPFSL